MMKVTQGLQNLGQSIWPDNITRDLLDSGTLARYIDELSVTGLSLKSYDLRPRDQKQHCV
jgi:transaldolase